VTGNRIVVTQIVTRFQAGAGTVALRGADALDPDRFAVSIIAGSGDRLLDEAATRYPVTVVPSLCSPIAPRRDLQALVQLTSLLRAQRPHVVHTHSSKAGFSGRLAAYRAGVPAIVHTYHGFPFHEFQSRPRRTAYIRIERALARITNHVLCVGTGVAAVAVRERLALPENVSTIGVPLQTAVSEQSPARRSAARARLGIDDDTHVVGFVGRLDYQKDPLTWVAAMGDVVGPQVTAVWVGSGPLQQSAEALIARLGLHQRVHLAGERSDVADLLPGFDVFAMASRYEGLPLALAEAMSARVPVVATAVNAVTDLVSPGETGLLVPPEDPVLLARAVRHLLGSPERAAGMAAAAVDRINQRYSTDALGDVLARIYGDGHDRASATADMTGALACK